MGKVKYPEGISFEEKKRFVVARSLLDLLEYVLRALQELFEAAEEIVPFMENGHYEGLEVIQEELSSFWETQEALEDGSYLDSHSVEDLQVVFIKAISLWARMRVWMIEGA